MEPASLCFQPERVQILQGATGCEKKAAITALYELEQYDWENFKRKPGEPGNECLPSVASNRMIAAQQLLKTVLIDTGAADGSAAHCVREFFLELSRQCGGNDLYVPQPGNMLKLLAVNSQENLRLA